jgi:hypothetical protein
MGQNLLPIAKGIFNFYFAVLHQGLPIEIDNLSAIAITLAKY